MPQSSRMIVTFGAWPCQRPTSPRCWAGAAAARQSALLTTSSIDRKGGSRGKNEMNGVARIYLYRAAGDQIQIGAGRHAGGDGGIQAHGLVIDRDEALVPARKRDCVGPVIPPVSDVGARDHVPEAHHVQDRCVAMLAHPLPDGGRFQTRR